MANELEISVKDEQGNVPIKVMYVSGEVNSATAETFQNKAKELHDGGAEYLLVDFGEVKYMSSAGLRAIHAIYQFHHSEEHDHPEGFMTKNLKLVNVPENVLKVIKAVGIDTQIEIYDDHATAVASF